jgi:hypothetical protein|tara:strand:+ start:316 stop:858 length:543 start_codon:yes stop_codon:yes gene_type:complete
MSNGQLQSPVTLTASEDDTLKRLGSDLGGCTAALEAMRDSLVVHVNSGGKYFWTFKHSTIGDAYSVILRGSPELLGIYVRGSDIQKLIRLITCGDVDIERAVVLTSSMFEILIKRLITYKTSSAYKTQWMSGWWARRELLSFFVGLCNKQFLELYLSADPKLIDHITTPRQTYIFQQKST